MAQPSRYFTIRMPEAMHADLERIAAQQDRSVSQVVRHALAAYLNGTADGDQPEVPPIRAGGGFRA